MPLGSKTDPSDLEMHRDWLNITKQSISPGYQEEKTEVFSISAEQGKEAKCRKEARK